MWINILSKLRNKVYIYSHKSILWILLISFLSSCASLPKYTTLNPNEFAYSDEVIPAPGNKKISVGEVKVDAVNMGWWWVFNIYTAGVWAYNKNERKKMAKAVLEKELNDIGFNLNDTRPDYRVDVDFKTRDSATYEFLVDFTILNPHNNHIIYSKTYETKPIQNESNSKDLLHSAFTYAAKQFIHDKAAHAAMGISTVSTYESTQKDIKTIAQNISKRRYALVIGNSNYQFGRLKNALNDANDISASLTELGFEVTLLNDASQKEMEDAIRLFNRKLLTGGVGLFYFAGHGIQSNGQNYMIPIGGNISQQSDLRYKAVSIGQVLDGMGEADNSLNIVMLDACRNNPLARSFRSTDRGLARMAGPIGSIIAFATAPGSVAADGDGRNGVYTKSVLNHIKTPGISIEEMFKRVLKSVSKESQGKQTPWVESSFTGDFYFVK